MNLILNLCGRTCKVPQAPTLFRRGFAHRKATIVPNAGAGPPFGETLSFRPDAKFRFAEFRPDLRGQGGSAAGRERPRCQKGKPVIFFLQQIFLLAKFCNVFPHIKGFAFCVTTFGFSKNSCTPLYYNKNRHQSKDNQQRKKASQATKKESRRPGNRKSEKAARGRAKVPVAPTTKER